MKRGTWSAVFTTAVDGVDVDLMEPSQVSRTLILCSFARASPAGSFWRRNTVNSRPHDRSRRKKMEMNTMDLATTEEILKFWHKHESRETGAERIEAEKLKKDIRPAQKAIEDTIARYHKEKLRAKSKAKANGDAPFRALEDIRTVYGYEMISETEMDRSWHYGSYGSSPHINVSQRLRRWQFHKCRPRMPFSVLLANAGQDLSFLYCWSSTLMTVLLLHGQAAVPAALYCQFPSLNFCMVLQFAVYHLDTPPKS